MVKSASLAAALALDSGFRRVVLPLVLLAASAFRYNIPSLLYFMFMLISTYLPDNSKKKDRIPSLVLTVLMALLSLFMTLAQPLFQISLATGYDDELEQCTGSSDEKIWRQFGFILFNAPASDVVRNYLPDIVVLVLSIFSGFFLLLVHIADRKPRQQAETAKPPSINQPPGNGSRGNSTSPAEDTSVNLISAGVMPSSEPNILQRLESSELPITDELSREAVVEEFGTAVEGKADKRHKRSFDFAKLPILFFLAISWKSFYIGFLWFSGICVACVLNFVYFACAVYLSLGWALHLNRTKVFKITRTVLIVIVSLFSAVHLILLYLYQLQSVQEEVPQSSVTARVLGFTGIVRVDCNRTTELLTHPHLEWPIYVNPISLLIVFWMSTSELRLYLFRSKSKSRRSHRSKREDKSKQETVNRRSTKGKPPTPMELQGIVSAVDDEADDDTVEKKQKKNIIWTVEDSRKILESVYAGMKWLLASFMEVNFVFSLIAMMVWSVVFPSWTSFVFLIWSCVVWVTPKFNPKDTVYYSTPLLVLYAIVLLLIQYLYNLNLTEGELESNIYAGLTRYRSPPDGAQVLAIGIKSLCAAIFLSSLFEFIVLHKTRWYAFLRHHCRSDDIALEGAADEDTTPTEPGQFEMSEIAANGTIVTDQPEASLFTRTLRSVAMPTDPYKYLKKYWILVTTGAFLLVILVGEVTLFKVVFMIFFLLFIFAYEFFPHNWYRIMEPCWMILIFYAFIVLTAIYTYQFSYISDLWKDALNSSHSELSVDEILESIGFFEVSIDTLSFDTFKDLVVTIVPTAVFVAVMALQLKYFRPPREDNQRNPFRESGQGERRQPDFVQTAGQPSELEKAKIPEDEDITLQAQDDTDLTSAPQKETTEDKHVQEVIKKYWVHFKAAFHMVNEFLWRLLEIYLPKVIIFVVFTVLLDEISATHFIVLAILVVTIPVDVNPVMYLILTAIISNLSLLKMLYQLALVDSDSFDFSDSCPNDTNYNPPPVGAVYLYDYERNDPGWLGFQKVECSHCSGFFDYIKWDIAVLLLIALSYTVSRRQKREIRGEQIPKDNRRALFWRITAEDADKSIINAIGHLINHVFDSYGLEICLSMFAIAIAVRTDVFGVLYAFALGIFLLTPHKALRPVWLLYLVIHGCLLLIQYAMLVNVPYGACIDDQAGKTTLPWNDIEPVGLKRWLWLPIASNRFFILNRDWLWADLLIYVVVSFQFHNLRRSLHEIDAIHPFSLNFLSFATSKEFADHMKRVIFKHFFWVTLFVVFVAGTSQVSLLGIAYLLATFALLWQGQAMLRFPKEKLRKWWFFLLLVIWFVLLVKISLQLYTCVYFEQDIDNDCIIVRLFNVKCEASSYYGTPSADSASSDKCSDLPSSIGLWLDSFAFVFVVLQIVIFSTDRFDSVRNYLIAKESADESVRTTTDLLDKINEELEKEREKEKVIKENIRKRLLEVQDKYKTSVVEHYLRAGVQLPDHIEFNEDDDDPVRLEPHRSLYQPDVPVIQQDEAITLDDVNTPEDEIVRSKATPREDTDSSDGSEKEKEKESSLQAVWKLIGNGLSFIDSGLVLLINYLRARSKYYRFLAKKRKQRREQAEAVELDAISSQPSQPVSVAEPAATTTEVILETTEEPPKQPSINSYDAAISEDEIKASSHVSINNEDYDELVAVDDGLIKSFDDVLVVWKRFMQRPLQLLIALYYAALANTEYICYLLIVINVMVNGSVLSLIYAALMFLWGLLSIPWPTKRFWLTLMFYTMFVIVVKYGFQFRAVEEDDDGDTGGLFWPQVLGIERRSNFLRNIVWDILLLISLFFHRSLLIDTGRWSVAGEGYFDILSLTKSDGTSAIQLVLRPRKEILDSLTSKDDKKEKEVDKSDGQEVSASQSQLSSSSEDDSSELGLLSYIVTVVKLNVKYFYHQIITPDISLGAHDYYVISFFMDTISFIIIAIGSQSFGLGTDDGAGGVNTVASYIQDNNIPITFVAMLFAHFLSMVIDRAIYLRKSVMAKLIFFLFQLVAWHLWLFFILPLPTITATAFIDNGYAQALYFFKCQYFIFSAQQCVSGFPKRVLGYFISKRYNLVASFTFQGYRAIPVLPDLKEVMDWMFTDTSLKLFHWLKVQEIWAQLYIIKNKRKREQNNPRVLGQPEGFANKLLVGGGFLILLILLIWGPLLLIALVNTTNVSNPPVEVSIELTLGSFEPLLSISVGEDSITRLNDNQYDELRNLYSDGNSRDRSIFRDNFRISDFRLVTFRGSSTALWDISPPSRMLLMSTLNPRNNTNPVRLTFSWQVSREPETGLASEVVSGQMSRHLNNQTRQMLNGILFNGSSNVFLAKLFPPFIYAPANGPSMNLDVLTKGVFANGTLSIQNITVTDENNVNISQEWWNLIGWNNTRPFKQIPSNSKDLFMVIYSERVSQPIFSFIAGLGIIGLYVSVVLVIGRALRSNIAALPSKITFNEIPNPDSLLELCDDIFYVREDGNLQQEEILVGRLFFIFRSPARLIQQTKWKKD